MINNWLLILCYSILMLGCSPTRILHTINTNPEEVISSGYIISNIQGWSKPTTVDIYDLALKSKKKQPVMNLEGSGNGSISKLGNNKLLAASGTWIYVIDMEKWQATKLVKGHSPVALKGHNKFLFISEDQGASSYLNIADMDKSPVSVREIYEIDDNMYQYIYLQVSKDKVISSGPKGDRYNAYEIDINTLQYQPSPVGECTPYIWFESQKRLLCWEGKVIHHINFFGWESRVTKNPFFLTKLDGFDRKLWNDEHLPIVNTGWHDDEYPIYYIPEREVLIINRLPRHISKSGDLYAYDMKNKKEVRLFPSHADPYDLIWLESLPSESSNLIEQKKN